MQIGDTEYRSIHKYMEAVRAHNEAVELKKTNPDVIVPPLPPCPFTDKQLSEYQLLRETVI